jgi:Domain of unknown function (DUF4401)
MIARPPVGQILARILPDDVDGGGDGGAARDRARAALGTYEASGVPWYLRLLTGIGAWAGGGFLLSFTTSIFAAMLGANNFEGIAIILGLIVMAAAVLLRRGVTAGNGVGPQFFRQLALVGCFSGQMLFIGGVGSTTSSTEAASAAAVIVSAILIAIYPDRIQRFCSTVSAAGSLWHLGNDIPYASDAIALVLAGATIYLGRIVSRRVSDEGLEIVEPMMYGCAITLFTQLIVSTAITMFGGPGDVDDIRWLLIGSYTTIGFVAVLLWLVASIFDEHGVSLGSHEALLAFAAIIGIGWITQSTPAITATILMLTLGFDRRARALIALSIVFFLMFGTAYYYGLHLTLLQKSGILAASGAFCLMASAFVRYRYRAHEEHV